MKLLCKILKQNPDSREGIIAGTSALGILVNLLIAALKVVLGLIANSIAIVSEGVNNASDALTSVLTLVGTKLAGKKPDAKHPFGYGRIEYLTSLTIAILIIVTGVEMITGAINLIFNPEEMEISALALVVVAVSAFVKFFLGVFTIKQGKKADSGALTAVGLDCRNDAFVSVVTIVSALVFIIFDFSIDAYVGIFTSLLILKAGIETLLDTLGELLGKPGDAELARKIYREVRATEGVLGAADMMLHNYGPEAYSGSVNLELDHTKTVDEIYRTLHALQLRIMHEYKVTMVFGIYAVDNDSADSKRIRKIIADFVLATENVKSFHAVYLDPSEPKLYCDLIVNYELRDWDKLEEDFTAYMAEYLPEREIVLTVETEFV